MKKRALSLLVCVSLLLTACQVHQINETVETSQTAQTIQESVPAQAERASADSVKQLLMIYMVGSDLETEAGMASRDIAEIIDSGFDEDNMKVLLCAGGTDYWWTEGISSESIGVYEVTGEGLGHLYTLTGDSMAEATTLTEFIDYGYDYFPAEHYSMVMWNHGGGAVLGFGADEKHDYDSLSLEELDGAFGATKLAVAGERLEWVGFDACLMAMLEVANVMADYAEYLIASEEMEAGEGWNYACLQTISDGEHFDGQKAAAEIIEAYSTYYESNYMYTPDYTMSCLDLNCTDEVVTELENLVEVAAVELYNNGYSKIAKMRDKAKSFGKISDAGFYDTVDLYDLSEKMVQQYPEQSQALQAALDDMVVNLATNVHGAHGVALYFPYENKGYAPEWMTEYETTGFSEAYTSFLKSFTSTLSGKSLADWNLSEVIPVESEETPGEYYVQLTEEQYANYARAKYSIWEEDSLGSYICWITSTEVADSEDGKISSGFDGKRFFIGDTSGNSMACCVAEIERNESYTKYAIPVLITPGKGVFSMEPAYIHFRVDEEHPEGEIIGIYENLKTDSTLFPNRDVVEIVEGDIISPFYFAADIVFNEDGSVGPYEEWKSASGVGNSFAVEGEFVVTLQKPEEDSEYCCLFEIIDTQGNSYFTNPIYVQH